MALSASNIASATWVWARSWSGTRGALAGGEAAVWTDWATSTHSQTVSAAAGVAVTNAVPATKWLNLFMSIPLRIARVGASFPRPHHRFDGRRSRVDGSHLVR